MRKGIYTDIGYRYQRNNIQDYHGILNQNVHHQEFFDIKMFNHDSFDHGQEDDEAIAALYLRLETNEGLYLKKSTQIDQIIIAPIASLMVVFITM